jgi:hypothetical protein
MITGRADRAVSPEIASQLERSPGLRGLLRERQALVLALAVLISLVLRMLTWSPIADGGHARYVKVASIGGAASVAVWTLIRVQAGPHRYLPLVSALGVLFAGDATHYVRLAHPIAHGAPVASLTSTFVDEAAVRRQWDFQTDRGGRLAIEPGAVVLESPPGATAFVRARLPTIPDVHLQWWLPVALAEQDPSERLTWRGVVSRTGRFYVMAEVRHLLVQAVSYGLHVTYPDERRTLTGHQIQTSSTLDGAVHEWRMTRNQGQLTLAVDGAPLWSAPQQEDLAQIRLGETRADATHGGSMRLEFVEYSATLSGS